MALQISPLPTWVITRQPKEPPDFHPFETITAYVNGGLSLSQTVNQIAEPVEEAYETDELRWVTLTGTWGAFNSFTEQVPHHHPAHSLMADLFLALRTRQTSPRPIPHQGDLWRDMPMWQPSFYPPWNSPSGSLRAATARQVDRDADTLGLLGGRAGLRERYMNSNAFLARLVNLKDAPPSIEIYALSALRWGLEGDLNAEEYDLNVPGAAMWMLHAGEHIFKSERARIEKLEDMVGLELEPHPLWDDEQRNGFCRERWNMWERRFSEIAEMDGVGLKTKELARQAIACMEQVEHHEEDELSPN